MKDLPKSARIYLLCVYAAAFAALIRVFAYPGILDWRASWLEVAAFAVVAVIGGHFKVPIMPGTVRLKDKDDGTMSLGFAIIFAALLRLGPEGAVITGIATTVMSCLRIQDPWYRFKSKPQPWFQFGFNVSVNIVETASASFVFLAINQHNLHLHFGTYFFAVVAASLTFFFLNTVSVAAVIALCDKCNIYKMWCESFLWTAPSYFAGAAVATGASVLCAVMGGPLPVVLALACAVVIGTLTQLSYKHYTDKANALAAAGEDLLASKDELATLYLATIRSLALAIDAKDQYTHKHILRVQKYSVATAKQMGFAGDELKAMETGALLHDIGKLGVPEYVLLKPGRLTDDEFDKIKQHPNIGADILDPVTFPWPVLPIVKHHHERMDGTGYPDGLKGEEIPLSARVLAVADVYDAITSSRSYRSAWTHERAMEEIKSKAGTHFDPQVVDAFCLVIDGVLAEEKALAETAAADVPALVKAGVQYASGDQKDLATTARSAEAVRSIQRASSELWALYEVAQTLSASLGINDTLEILARKLNAIFPETGCVFLLRDFTCDDVPDAFVARSAVGLNSVFFDGCRTLRSDSLSLRVARERRAYLGVYDHDDLMPIGSSGTAWKEIGTALIVPIVHQGEMLGTINLYHADVNAFASHDQYLLEMIGERAALALYNGLLFDRTKSDAITDPLTGLFNVRHFTECVEEHIRSAANPESKGAGENSFALLCLDLDCFKPINDNFGHQRGDRVLCDVSQLLSSLVGKHDVVSRYGGDEFLILLHGATPAEAANTAWRIQETVTAYDPQLRHPKLGDLRIDVSVGIACFPDSGSDSATLLSVADAAMYANKTERKLKNLAGMERTGNATVGGVTGAGFASAAPIAGTVCVAPLNNIATASNNGVGEEAERVLTGASTNGAHI